MNRMAFPLVVLIGAAVIGAAIGVGSTVNLPTLASFGPAPQDKDIAKLSCRVVDGDTLRCGEERVRLLGIDSPEMEGHCARGRRCAPGDPISSTESLRDALGTGMTKIVRVGTDRYGRTLAVAYSDRGNLSCWQLSQGQAIYRSDWDDGGRVARDCPQ